MINTVTAVGAQEASVSAATTTVVPVTTARVKPGQHVLVDVLGISTNKNSRGDRLAGEHSMLSFDRDSLELAVLDGALPADAQPLLKLIAPDDAGHWTVVNGHISFFAQPDVLNKAQELDATVKRVIVSTDFRVKIAAGELAEQWATGTVTMTIAA